MILPPPFSDSPPSSREGDQNSLPPLKMGVRDGGGSPDHDCALKYQTLLKNTRPSFLSGPLKSTNCQSLSHFRQSPLRSILVFHEPPSKSWIFQ